jgi:hypothetical protein
MASDLDQQADHAPRRVFKLAREGKGKWARFFRTQTYSNDATLHGKRGFVRLESGGVRLAQEDRIRTACSACPDVEPWEMQQPYAHELHSLIRTLTLPQAGGWDLGAARRCSARIGWIPFHLY